VDFVSEQAVSIVANGSFNPTIFQPAWLREQGIINAEEEAAATIEVIHPEIARFQVPGITFDVQTERCSFVSQAEPFIRIADIFYVTFVEKLGHTPMTSVGMNYSAHVQLNDWRQRTRFGRALAPLQPWGDYGAQLDAADPKTVGGMSNLSMRAIRPDFGEDGGINVSVQPSVKVPANSGVFFNVYFHFGEGAGAVDGNTLAAHIHAKFDDVLREARAIVENMTSTARLL
jgi:hypothetical protein